MRRRRSTRASSGMLMWKGRILSPSCTAASYQGRRLTALVAAAVARASRRVGHVADMKFSFVGVSDSIDAVGGTTCARGSDPATEVAGTGSANAVARVRALIMEARLSGGLVLSASRART